jgi:hypothetical protein
MNVVWGVGFIAAPKVNPESVGQLHRLPKQGKLRKGQMQREKYAAKQIP